MIKSGLGHSPILMMIESNISVLTYANRRDAENV